MSVTSQEFSCSVCHQKALGMRTDTGWVSLPNGWFYFDSDQAVACSEICCQAYLNEDDEADVVVHDIASFVIRCVELNDILPFEANKIIHALDGDALPVLSMTTILTEAPITDSWATVRSKIIHGLLAKPEQATSILDQAQKSDARWPAPEIHVDGDGASGFTATISLIDETVTAKARQKKQAIHLAAVRVLAAISEVELPSGEERLPAGDVRDPVSALEELCKLRRSAPPLYNFEFSGPPHSPTVRCTVSALGKQASNVGLSKKSVKKIVARMILVLNGES